jgi:hypothetical protein
MKGGIEVGTYQVRSKLEAIPNLKNVGQYLLCKDLQYLWMSCRIRE